jgi:hypothetical protein
VLRPGVYGAAVVGSVLWCDLSAAVAAWSLRGGGVMADLGLRDDLVRGDGLQGEGRIGRRALGSDFLHGLPCLVLGLDENHSDAFTGVQAAEPRSSDEPGPGLCLGHDNVFKTLSCLVLAARVGFALNDDCVHFDSLSCWVPGVVDHASTAWQWCRGAVA